MTKPVDTIAIEVATGIAWSDWLAYFRDISARNMTHAEIASKAHDHLVAIMTDEGKETASPGWWAQSIAVAYEQSIGRRAPGQKSDGTFEVSVSKTLPGNKDDVLEWWNKKVSNNIEFFEMKFTTKPSTSKTEKWCYWRVKLEDNVQIVVTTSNKAPGKAVIVVTTSKLTTSEQTETWRKYWTEFLNS